MPLSNLIVLSISIVLNAWLVALLVRRGAAQKLPAFLGYSVFALFANVARAATSFHYRWYFFAYWWTSAPLILLSLVTLDQVFRMTFEDLYHSRVFRLCYYSAIAAVSAIAVGYALVNPFFQSNRVTSLIFHMGRGADFVRVAVAALFYILRRVLDVEFRRHAYGIVLGFGIASAGSLVAILGLSIFGMRFEPIARHSWAVAYILGQAIWVSAFIRPEPTQKNRELPMSPEQMLEEVRRYLRALGVLRAKQ